MLAQNFLSSSVLGITDIELESLIKVMGMLERGELQQRKSFDIKGNYIRMSDIWKDDADCGSIGCICGWAHHISGGEAFPRLNSKYINVSDMITKNHDLNVLFGVDNPNGIPSHVARAKPEQVAKAIRNYLTTGKAKWHEALAS
jgi:hypothetical protein